MAQAQSFTRRSMLKRTAAAAACVGVPWVVPGSALGAGDRAAPSERITVGMIGTGRQAFYKNMPQFVKMPDVELVALCDVDSWRMGQMKEAIEKHYAQRQPSGSHRGLDTYKDYRDILARNDVDAVMISTPDHWHVPMAIEAADAGKDVSLEKPNTRSIAEGQAMVKAIRRNKRVFRMDSEFRSLENFYRMAELVRNGRVGKIKAVYVGVPAGDNVECPPTPDMPVPDELDYDAWQGPAPRAPYTVNRVHPPKDFGRPGWMRVLDYCDGMITNWGVHLCDIAKWCCNCERTGPIEIEGEGVWPEPGHLWNVLKTFKVNFRYADGTPWVFETVRPYVRVEGTEGWIEAEFSRKLSSEPASLLTSEIKPDEIHFPMKSDKQDFIDAVKTRGQTLEDEEVAHCTTTLCHLGHIAIWLGQPLRWDPAAERFIDNDAANRMIDKPIHAMPT